MPFHATVTGGLMAAATAGPITNSDNSLALYRAFSYGSAPSPVLEVRSGVGSGLHPLRPNTFPEQPKLQARLASTFRFNLIRLEGTYLAPVLLLLFPEPPALLGPCPPKERWPPPTPLPHPHEPKAARRAPAAPLALRV